MEPILRKRNNISLNYRSVLSKLMVISLWANLELRYSTNWSATTKIWAVFTPQRKTSKSETQKTKTWVKYFTSTSNRTKNFATLSLMMARSFTFRRWKRINWSCSLCRTQIHIPSWLENSDRILGSLMIYTRYKSTNLWNAANSEHSCSLLCFLI